MNHRQDISLQGCSYIGDFMLFLSLCKVTVKAQDLSLPDISHVLLPQAAYGPARFLSKLEHRDSLLPVQNQWPTSYPQIQKNYGEQLCSSNVLWLQEGLGSSCCISIFPGWFAPGPLLKFTQASFPPIPGEQSQPQWWELKEYTLHAVLCLSAGTSNQKNLPTLSGTIYTWSCPISLGSRVLMWPTVSSPLSQRHSQDPSGCEDLSQ